MNYRVEVHKYGTWVLLLEFSEDLPALFGWACDCCKRTVMSYKTHARVIMGNVTIYEAFYNVQDDPDHYEDEDDDCETEVAWWRSGF